MDSFHKMHDDLESVIEKDSCTIMAIDSARQTPELVDGSLRQKLDHIIHSNTFMVLVIVLVILDMLVVITELLFDLEVVHLKAEYHTIPKSLHYVSIIILGIFIVEIFARLYVMRRSFFKHKLEMFDAVVVIISFILDIVFRNNEDASVGVGLLVALRLWRVTRIVNGIVMSVQKQARKKIAKERERFEACAQELMTLQELCSTQKEEIERLHQIIKQHNIEFVSSNIIKPASSTQVDIGTDFSCSLDGKENVVVM